MENFNIFDLVQVKSFAQLALEALDEKAAWLKEPGMHLQILQDDHQILKEHILDTQEAFQRAIQNKAHELINIHGINLYIAQELFKLQVLLLISLTALQRSPKPDADAITSVIRTLTAQKEFFNNN